MGRFRDFRGSLYGRWERGQEPNPEAFEEWRLREIERVRVARVAARARLVAAIRTLAAEQPARFATLEAARATLEPLREEGKFPGVTWGADQWLAARIREAGITIAMPRRQRRGIRLSTHEERIMHAWLETLRRDASRYAVTSLDELYRSLWRYAGEHAPELHARLGPLKLSRWLQSQGFERGRSREGVFFRHLLPARARPLARAA